MWSIILRKDNMSYDVIPNCWILCEEECLYPDAGLSKTKKMAVDCTQPDTDWDTVPIEVQKRNVDNFDRGLSDVIRMTLGKCSVTSSENEDRGRGKRKLKSKHRLDFENESNTNGCDADDSDQEEELEPSLMSSNSGEGCETNAKVRRVPSYPNLTPLLKKQKIRSPKTHSPRIVESPVTLVESQAIGCRLKGKKHICCFNNKNDTNIEMLGQAICSLSRELNKINTNMSYLRECQDELQKSLEVLMGRTTSTGGGVPEPQLPPECIIEDFPLASLEKLGNMEEKLREREFMLKCVAFAASSAEKTSENRTISSIMAKLITPEVAVNFTWKGIQRKDQKIQKKSFQELNIAKVMIAATKKCWGEADLKKIHLTAANWLAQSQAKLDKMKGKSPTTTVSEEV